MKSDLEELADKYESLTDTEKMDLEIQAHGQVTSEWAMKGRKKLIV